MGVQTETIWFRVRGHAQAVANTLAVANAQMKAQAATASSGKAMQAANHHGFVYNQTLFTMRRYLYAATLGLTALGAAAAITGFKFQSNMEKAQVSFEFLMKQGPEAARKEIDLLYELAAKTPFQFQPLLDTARRFIAFGFSVEETNKALFGISDAIAAMGGSQELIDRVTTALGQMLVKGKVTGEELRQLSNAMIPAPRYIQEAFHLTERGFARVADAGIPAKAGIDAILRGIEQDFGGAAERLQNTVSGQFSTMKDYVNLLLGTLMRAPFLLIQGQMKTLNDDLKILSETMRDKGWAAFVMKLDELTGSSGHLQSVIFKLEHFFRAFGTTLRDLSPLLKDTAGILILTVAYILDFIGYILDGINKIPYLNKVLAVLVGWLFAEFIITRFVVYWQKKNVFWTFAQFVANSFLVKGLVNLIKWMKFQIAFTRLLIVEEGILAAVQYLVLGPWLLLIAAAIALVAGLIYLQYRLKEYRKWILAALFVMNPFAFAIALVVDYFDQLKNAVEATYKAMRDLWNFMSDKADRLFGWIPEGPSLLDITGHIPGGNYSIGDLFHDISGGGRSAQGNVAPKATPALAEPQGIDLSTLAGANGMDLNIAPAPVILDGRQIAEVVFQRRLDRFARQ